MEGQVSNCIAPHQQEHLNIAGKEEKPRMLVYFQEPQSRDHGLFVPLEPDWM